MSGPGTTANGEALAALTERFRLDLYQLQDGAYSIGTPFIYGDGDGMPVVLERRDGGWRFTDRGCATSHLFFDDIELTDAHLAFIRRMAERDGLHVSEHFELSTDKFENVPDEFDLADFIAAIARVEAAVSL